MWEDFCVEIEFFGWKEVLYNLVMFEVHEV